MNGEWIAESPVGTVKVEFSAVNEFGILDHYVTLPSGERVYNPFRIFPNDAGSEAVFTVYWRPGVSDDEFSDDVRAVTRDLDSLKALLERQQSERTRDEKT